MKHLIPTITAKAHCDVPCGIYDPTPAKIAAKTVARMVDQFNELDPKIAENVDKITRRIAVKEAHAETCKRELSVLWTDFFNEKHLEQFPDLHERFWKATKLCSEAKQDGHGAVGTNLCDAVDAIAEMFYKAKGVPDRFAAYKEITDNLY